MFCEDFFGLESLWAHTRSAIVLESILMIWRRDKKVHSVLWRFCGDFLFHLFLGEHTRNVINKRKVTKNVIILVRKYILYCDFFLGILLVEFSGEDRPEMSFERRQSGRSKWQEIELSLQEKKIYSMKNFMEKNILAWPLQRGTLWLYGDTS